MVDVRRLPVWEDEALVAVTLDDLAREGARRMIATALEAEVADCVAAFADERDDDDKRLVGVATTSARSATLCVSRCPRPRTRRPTERGMPANPGLRG